MDNFDSFPEGMQAVEFAMSNGVPPEVPHILWEGLRRAGLVVRWLDNVRSRTYADDTHLDNMGLGSFGLDSHTLNLSEESLVRYTYRTCEKILTHPDIDEDVTTEHLTHIVGVWMSTGILNVSWESIILSSAEEVFGEKLSYFDVSEVVLILKSVEPQKRLGMLSNYFSEKMAFSPDLVDSFLQVMLRRITPFL